MASEQRGGGRAAAETRRRLVEEMADFASAFLRWVDAAAADGLSYPRLRVLQRLRCTGPEQMCALAEQLGISPRNMTALVDALESEGLAVRRPHPTDRRSFLVELTERGCVAASASYECRISAIGEIFDGLTDAQADALLDLLRTVRPSLRR